MGAEVFVKQVVIVAVGVLGFISQDAAAFGKQNAYRVEHREGAWWFVNPRGESFFSLGVNCVHQGPGPQDYNSSASLCGVSALRFGGPMGC